MANWRESILKHFHRRVARLTLVSDPDGLLTEEGMLSAVRQRGFDLLPFDDSIAFRFAYESQYRSQWDQGLDTDLVVVLRSSAQRLEVLPYDLLKAGRQLKFALHQLFPKLNYPVLAALDRGHLDAIDEAYHQHDGEQLTERETKEFVLMHCFGIVPKLIKTPVDILKVLLSLHSRQVRLPDMICQFLLESLTKQQALAAWPLSQILPSREAFLRFLQSQWPGFLAGLISESDAGSGADDGRQSRPACLVPFGHEDVRVYVDTLFLEGQLAPVDVDQVTSLPTWVQTGVRHDPHADIVRRYRRLRDRFEQELPDAEAPHRAWQQAAERWADLVVLRWECDEWLDAGDRTAWETLQAKIEDEFGQWMMSRYGALHNLSYHQQPVMVHHIPRFLAVERNRRKLAKIALLVLDGLALDQWLLLRRSLETTPNQWRFEEMTAFAWVPTLTCVTRQSIFAGEPPLYFPESFDTTAKEKAHWVRYWEDQGVSRGCADLIPNLEACDDPRLDTVLANSRLSVLAIVWNKVDEIMHGMQMETSGMHNQVRLWASQGHLQQLLLRLHAEGFHVFLTADHGNVTATGIGSPKEGVLADTKGKRARVYDRPDFRQDVAAKFPDSVCWPGYGLPPARHVLLAGDLKAFTGVGDRIVAHGGIALEEVLVPFVAISRVDG